MDRYEMLKCCGCDRVLLRHMSWFMDDPEPTVRFYPPAMFRKEPAWSFSFRISPRLAFVHQLLREIYVGIQNDTKMTATMGVRALLEHVIIDKVGDQGTFSRNLTEFASKGFISEQQRSILEAVLEAGHATIHRSYQPSDEDLHTCVDIAESILQTLYVHPGKAARLAKRVPPRENKVPP